MGCVCFLIFINSGIKKKKRYILLLNFVMKGVMILIEKFDDYKRKDRIDSDYSDYKEEYVVEVVL